MKLKHVKMLLVVVLLVGFAFAAAACGPEYTVSFEANGGSAVASQTVASKEKAVKPAAPSKTGYAFEKWYSDEGLSEPFDFETPIESDVTLYAKWEAKTFTLTYDYQGATGENSALTKDVKYDANYVLATPIRTGYTFAGWYSQANGTGTNYTGADGASLSNWDGLANATAFAKWEAKTFSLTYDYQGATGENSALTKDIKYDANYALSTPVRTGYTFAGWYSQANGTGVRYTGTDGASLSIWKVADDATVYARWVKDSTITYDYQSATGGKGEATQVLKYEQSYTLAVPTRTGYDFGGWYSKANGGGECYAEADGKLSNWQGGADATVYAYWYTAGLKFELISSGTGYSVSKGTAGNESAIIIPHTYNKLPVIEIGQSAFSECSSLTSVSIPNSVTQIGNWAFSECSSLKTITIPSSVTQIGELVFAFCSTLTSISVDADNTKYSSLDGVLFNTDKTILIQCPATKSGSYSIPSSVKILGNGAFYACNLLSTVTISKGITEIGDWTFYKCSALNSLIIPDGVISIGTGAFKDCFSLKSITIPDSVLNIGDSAFNNCRGLESITIPSSVTELGEWLFVGCASLVTVSIEGNITSISEGMFSQCSSLKSITISDKITNIGSGAFEYCYALTSINVDANNANYSSADGVLFNKNKTILIQCPTGKAGSYSIPSGVVSIGDKAFYRCRLLTAVTIPDSVTSIGTAAFASCNLLTSISVDASNANYSSENGILFNKSKTILIQCPATKNGSYIIPGSVTQVGDYAFASCSSLTAVTIPSSVTQIGVWAFSESSSLTTVTIPNSVTQIGDYAFAFCSSLVSVAIPSSVTQIGDYVFEYCSLLKTITIPSSVTTVGVGIFSYSGMETIYVKGLSNAPAGWSIFWQINCAATVSWNQ